MKYLSMIFIIGLTVMAATSAHAGREVVGIFLKFEDNCKVIHEKQKIPCEEGISLRPGDAIVTSRPLDSLKVQWIQTHPPTKKEGHHYYKVVSEVREESDLISLIPDILNFSKKASHVHTHIGTQGDDKMMQSPGDNATLLPGMPITFSWDGRTARKLVIKDSSGKVVFEQPQKGVSSLALIPEQMGLKIRERYKWEVEGTNSHGENLRLLDDKNAGIVKDAIKEIEANNKLKTSDKVIAIASFVLFMSESYPEEVSLNWLSYQLIDQQESTFPEDQKRVAKYLKARSNFDSEGM